MTRDDAVLLGAAVALWDDIHSDTGCARWADAPEGQRAVVREMARLTLKAADDAAALWDTLNALAATLSPRDLESWSRP